MALNATVNPCLVIVFNYRHDENLDKLERIYQNRFPARNYLIPFYDGDRPLTIPVYISSHNFQGYFAEAYDRLDNGQFTHFILCADDLLLHPGLNSANIIDQLKLDDDSGYIKSFSDIEGGVACTWPHALPALAAYSHVCYKHDLSQWQELLPSPEDAARLMERHGLPWRPLNGQSLAGYFKTTRRCCADAFAESILREIETAGQWYPYPFAWTYADFAIVPAKYFKTFCYYCGVFAAMEVFVEIALPTALLFSCPKIVTETTRWKGTEIWEAQELAKLREQHHNEIGRLMAGFGPNQLYIHPIKLSQWAF